MLRVVHAHLDNLVSLVSLAILVKRVRMEQADILGSADSVDILVREQVAGLVSVAHRVSLVTLGKVDFLDFLDFFPPIGGTICEGTGTDQGRIRFNLSISVGLKLRSVSSTPLISNCSAVNFLSSA